VIQNTARGRGGVDGQKEDEGQGDEERRSEEGRQGCWCQARDRQRRAEAAPAGSEDIPSGARGPRGRRIAGSARPPPRLVAVPLLETLIAKSPARSSDRSQERNMRLARFRGAGRERVPRRRAHWRGRSAASVQGRYGGLADLDEAPGRLVPALVAPAVPPGHDRVLARLVSPVAEGLPADELVAVASDEGEGEGDRRAGGPPGRW